MGRHLSRAHGSRAHPSPKPGSFRQRLLGLVGPGFIAGASDDDPSGIATYSQVGAQFGYGLLWTIPFSFPLMTAIQDISARIGRVTGHGIAGNLRRFYPHWVGRLMVGLMVLANVLNIGADLAAMGETMRLLVGGTVILYAVLLAVGSALLQVFVPYRQYARFLRWLTFALFTYIAVAFVVKVPWGDALRGALLPRFSFDAKVITAVIAVLGTTISPYVFFWQASEEAEDTADTPGDRALKRAPWQARAHLRRINEDTVVGMLFSHLVAFFIILSCAATLHARGIDDIESASQAAEALRPIAGDLSFLLFCIGIVGTGLLAIPVLAGSAAYAVGEILQWHVSLESKPRDAKGFYGVLVAAMLFGLAVGVSGINPIRALFWTAVINGLVAGPVMVMIMLLAGNRRAMGDFRVPRVLYAGGWLATAVMLLATIAMFASWML